jgi:hypothetical protein
MNEVPPHFHKTDRISEKDLIPDGDTVSVIPDWPAPEGTEVSYLNGLAFKRYKMISGVWREIGGGSDVILTSYTSDYLTGLTVSGLDLDVNLRYKMYIKADADGFADIPYLQFNGLSTPTYNFMAKRRRMVGGAFTEANLSGAAVPYIDLDSHSHFSYLMELDLALMNTGSKRVSVSYRVRGLGAPADSNDDATIVDGIGWEMSANNLTSLYQGWITNKAFTYKAWVYIFPTS